MKDRFPEPFVRYDITAPDGRLVVFEGPGKDAYAARLWAACGSDKKARFVAILPSGEEFGTKRPWEFQGRHGFFEKCLCCEREFRCQQVGDTLCQGCELVNSSSREEHF